MIRAPRKPPRSTLGLPIPAAPCRRAGAYYGVDAIPEDWRRRLAQGDRLLMLADLLLRHRVQDKSGASQPVTSNLNYTVGGTRANLVVIPVSAAGFATLFTLEDSHYLVNV